MTIHSSLAKKGFGKSHRNVLKKFERVKRLQAAEGWTEETRILGMPKVKLIKIKKK